MADPKKALRKVKMPFYIIVAMIVVGLALFIGSFIYGVKGAGVAMLVIGALMAFGGLVFGLPLTILFSVEKKKTLKLAIIASQKERTMLSVLAGAVGCTEAEARDKALWCLSNGYLEGYMLRGNEICHQDMYDPNLQKHAVECPNCGASFSYVGKIGQCPYCGDYYPPQGKV